MGQGHGSQNTKQPPEKQGPEEKRGGDGLNGGQWSRKGRAGTEASSLNLSLSWERCTVSRSTSKACTGSVQESLVPTGATGRLSR